MIMIKYQKHVAGQAYELLALRHATANVLLGCAVDKPSLSAWLVPRPEHAGSNPAAIAWDGTRRVKFMREMVERKFGAAKPLHRTTLHVMLNSEARMGLSVLSSLSQHADGQLDSELQARLQWLGDWTGDAEDEMTCVNEFANWAEALFHVLLTSASVERGFSQMTKVDLDAQRSRMGADLFRLYLMSLCRPRADLCDVRPLLQADIGAFKRLHQASTAACDIHSHCEQVTAADVSADVDEWE